MGTEQIRARTLRGIAAFRTLFELGSRRTDRHCSLVFLEQSPGGIAVCIKRGPNSVMRNRMKRITREAAEPAMASLRPGIAVAVFPHPSLEKLKSEDRVEAIRAALSRAGLLQ